MTDRMTEDRFEALVAAYGADPMRWPDAERPAAQRLAATDSPRVSAALAEAEALDGMLAQATVPEMSDSALAAMTRRARPTLTQRLRGLIDWQGPIWQPAGALTAALVLGIALGISDPDTAATLADISDEAEVETLSPLDPFYIGEDML